MSKLIRLSDRDTETLAKIQKLGAASSFTQPQSYEDRVVVKPWGYEFLVFQNEHVAVWRLRLEKGHATSMHCHPKKKTSLIVLAGQALCNTFFNRNYLNGVDGVIIEAGVFHSTQALSQGGCDIIEIESPPDKLDLVRLDDQYGRSGKGYEGLSEMKTENLDRYHYFSFKEPSSGSSVTYQSEKYKIDLVHVAESTPWSEKFSFNRGDLFSSCRGSVIDKTGVIVASTGDVVEGAFLSTFENLIIEAGSSFLCFQSS